MAAKVFPRPGCSLSIHSAMILHVRSHPVFGCRHLHRTMCVAGRAETTKSCAGVRLNNLSQAPECWRCRLDRSQPLPEASETRLRRSGTSDQHDPARPAAARFRECLLVRKSISAQQCRNAPPVCERILPYRCRARQRISVRRRQRKTLLMINQGFCRVSTDYERDRND